MLTLEVRAVLKDLAKESVAELVEVEETGLGPDSEALRLAALLSFRPSFQASLPASL